MKIKPLRDYILLQEKKLVEQFKTNVNLPEETDMDRPDTGTVISAGPNTNIAEGQTVYFQRHLFTKIFTDTKEEFWIGKEENIIAIVE